MGLSADMRLFARKGEAAPAGAGLEELAPETGAREPVQSGYADAHDGHDVHDDPGVRESAGLSFLIQRRKPQVVDSAAERKVAAPASGQGRSRPAKASVKPHRGTASGRGDPRPVHASPTTAAPAEEAPEAWRKLSFRVRNDQYRKLKALSGLWGASYQGILERAVAAFVDSAIGAEDADWEA